MNRYSSDWRSGCEVWICTEEHIEANYAGGWFSGGDVPDTFHTLDGRKLKLNVPLCVMCDHPVEECTCLAEPVLGDPFLNAAVERLSEKHRRAA